MDDLQKIQNEIAQLQRQVEQLISQRKAEVIESIKELIKTYGITTKDIGLLDKPHSSRAGQTVPVKYRLHEQIWTGRGRQPKWVDDYLAAGGNLEDVRVK